MVVFPVFFGDDEPLDDDDEEDEDDDDFNDRRQNDDDDEEDDENDWDDEDEEEPWQVATGPSSKVRSSLDFGAYNCLDWREIPAELTAGVGSAGGVSVVPTA